MNNSQKIFETIEFAARCHRGQIRKGSGLPFIVHPLAVLTVVGSDWGISSEIVRMAAICHDIEEDCEITHEQLAEVIGVESANIVSELTFHPDPNDVRAKHEQKKDYMKTFMTKSVSALVIKCADRYCNVYDFMQTNPSYAEKYWLKAEDLMNVMLSREDEIYHEFGSETFYKINNVRKSIIDKF